MLTNSGHYFAICLHYTISYAAKKIKPQFNEYAKYTLLERNIQKWFFTIE